MGTLKRFNLKRLQDDFALACHVGCGSRQREDAVWAAGQGLQPIALNDNFFADAQLTRQPALFFLAPDVASAANSEMQTSVHSTPLAEILAQLLQARQGCHDVIIIDQSSMYFPGSYQAGDCPPAARRWNQGQDVGKAIANAEATHSPIMCHVDQGYVVLLPRGVNNLKTSGQDIERYLNMLPCDRPESFNLLLGIAGATSISMQRRMFDSRFATRYFSGCGLDVGGGIDSLALYAELFPLIRNVVVYDEPHGDAQFLQNVPDDVFDFLYSSHCLEHVRDPQIALGHWIRVVRPGGYLVLSVPDEDLYEQGVWPSTFNADHKKTFTIHKPHSWSPVSINVLDLVRAFSHVARPISIVTVDHAYRFELERFDQTTTPLAECSIEIVLRKL